MLFCFTATPCSTTTTTPIKHQGHELFPSYILTPEVADLRLRLSQSIKKNWKSLPCVQGVLLGFFTLSLAEYDMSYAVSQRADPVPCHKIDLHELLRERRSTMKT